MMLETYYNRGYVKWQVGDYQSAIVDFNKAIELGFNSANAYYYRALGKNFLGQHDIAIPDYNEAIKLKQDFVEAYHGRGCSHGELGQYNQALADCSEAIRLKSNYAEAYANRGMTRVRLDTVDEARSDFQKALELAEQQGHLDLKVFVERQLQQLDQAASKQREKKARQGGQWKGKVKIAEDFDELPESFMKVFREDNE